MSKLRAPAAAPAILCVFLAVPAAAGTITYEAFAGSIGGNFGGGSGNLVGNGSSGNGQNCTTSALSTLTIGSGFSTGISPPSGGVGPCGYYGGSFDRTGSTAQSAATGLVSATFGGSTFSGSATAFSSSASTGEFALTTDASSNYLGGSDSALIDESSAAAGADDPNWTISCPTCVAGGTYHPVYVWAVTASATANQNFVYQQDLYGVFNLNLEMQTTPDNQGALTAYAAFPNPGATPTWTCYQNPVCPSFTTGPGTLSGTSTFSYSPFDQGITLGAGNTTTVDEKVGLYALTQSTAVNDLTASLIAVNWVDRSGNAVSGITLTTSTGIYANGGYTAFSSSSPTPEPPSWILCVPGILLCLFGLQPRRRIRRLS